MHDEAPNLDLQYEIAETSEAIRSYHATRIALQFPDAQLKHSAKVVALLKERCRDCDFFILADTSYGRYGEDVRLWIELITLKSAAALTKLQRSTMTPTSLCTMGMHALARKLQMMELLERRDSY